MEDLDSLRHQYSSLRAKLDEQQGMLNAYLRGRIPTRGAAPKDGKATARQDRRGRNTLAENSQWTSTPIREQHDVSIPEQWVKNDSGPYTPTNQRTSWRSPHHEPHHQKHSERTRTPGKRKSNTDAPRQVGRGSSLEHHGSESKRLRSMERRHLSSYARRAGGTLQHPRSSGKHTHFRSKERIRDNRRMEGLREREEHFSASSDPRNRSRPEESRPAFESYLDEERWNQEELPAEGSYVEQLLSQGNDRMAAVRAPDISPKPRSILLTPGGRTRKTPARVSFLERLNKGHQNSPIRVPHRSQIRAPHRSHISAPLRSPISAPHRSPISAPHRSPISAPHRSPISAPHRSPIRAPLRSPSSAAHSSSYRAPNHSPYMAPSRSPYGDPSHPPYGVPSRSPYGVPKGPTDSPQHGAGSVPSTSLLQGSLHDRSVGNVTQPLLGYDWIAGVLDSDPAGQEQSNALLEEIKLFRQLNREECVHTAIQAEEQSDVLSISQGLHGLQDPDYARTKAQEHKCIHNYALNDRLFAVPLHGGDDGESVCAICQRRRSSKQGTRTSPSYIRVSIPRSTLMSPYRVRPHRRQSFDPTDSVGLSQHCLAGWQNSRPSMMPPASSVDLKASLDRTMRAASTLFNPAPEDSALVRRPAGPSPHTQDLLNRSHALRVDLQRLERSGLSMETSMAASRIYPLL